MMKFTTLNFWIKSLIRPVKMPLMVDVLALIPRFICGCFLAFSFGASKFGMPWTDPEQELRLFQVAEWFPGDVAAFGGIFTLAPHLFAWLGAASEAIGGLFLALGLGTRIAAFFIMTTMLVAVFFQKWGDGLWGMLPALGFLWVAIYALALGSGRFGLDFFLTKNK